MRPLSDVLLDTLLDLLPPARGAPPPGEPGKPPAGQDRSDPPTHGRLVEHVEPLDHRDRIGVPYSRRQRH